VDDVGGGVDVLETMLDEESRLETVNDLIGLVSSLVMLKACEVKP
jgi:hypothetical protein